MPRVAGVDGCPTGWVVAVLDLDDAGDADPAGVSWHHAAHAGELAELADLLCIDIPIGLPDRGRRTLEAQVRKRLPGRGSTVFPTPVRAVLAEAPPTGDYGRACTLSRERCDGRAISRQTWHICPKIAEVDEVLARTPGLDDRVAEAHPELAFTTMAGGVPPPPKRTAAGALRRRELLNAWLGATIDVTPARALGAALDDLLDAAACAWVARRWWRGEAEIFADPGALADSTGRPMRIVC